jgi:outer membrane biosynthesis protein TonB
MNEELREKKNKRTALLYTTVIQVVLVIALFFIVAWRAPDPPIPEYGIVLNFGMDTEGFGETQPEKPVGNKGDQKEEKVEETKPEVQEEVPKVEEKIEEVKPAEVKPEPQVVSKVESPVVVKEKKEEVKPIEKPAEKPVEKPVEQKPKEVEKPKVNPDAVFKPNPASSTAENKTGGNKEGEPGNHGNDPGKTGDKGDPKGTPNPDGLYTGKPGGGAGGSSLELSGWAWDEKPSPNVPNNESGRLVFEIKVDSNGDIVSIRTLERSVSTAAEQICRRSVEKLTFSKTGSNVPDMSTGKITFLMRAK